MPNKSAVIAKITILAKYYVGIMKGFGDIQSFAAMPGKIEDIVPLQTHKHEKPANVTMPYILQESKAPTLTSVAIGKVSAAINPEVENAVSTINTLEELQKYTEKAALCDIRKFATQTVFGDGNPNAKILVIGEAPGREEDLAGVPFCGQSGKLLMNAFSCIKLERAKNFYITNNIFWRPPGNRKPTEEELAACKPVLNGIIRIIDPKIIICVGAVAVQNILGSEQSVSSLRRKELSSPNYKQKIFAVYHPSYILRTPSKKYEMYKDLLFISEYITDML